MGRLRLLRSSPHLAALAAVLAVLYGVWLVDGAERARAEQEHRARVLAQISATRAQLERALHERLSVAQALAAYVASGGDTSPAALDRFAQRLLSGQRGIRHVALSEGTTITYVWPRAGNEAALGVDLLETQAQAAPVLRALQSHHPVVAGPVSLVQGGSALIARVPVVLAAENGDARDARVWGLAHAVIETDALLSAGWLLDRQDGLRWALRGVDGWGSHGDVFYGDGGVFEARAESLEVGLPSGSWLLAAVPEGGWTATGPLVPWVRLGGGAIAALVGLLVYTLVRSPLRLREAVDRATAELRESQAQLERRVAERTRELATLLDVSRAVASTLDLEALVSLVLDELLGVLRYAKARVWLVEGEEVVLLAERGSTGRADEEADLVVLARGEPLRMPLAPNSARSEVVERRAPVLRGDWLGVPLVVRDRVIGLIGIDRAEVGEFTQQDADLALAFANQAAAAIENARLYERAHDEAALEERQRLARELHDSVTQTLFSASLIAEVLPRLWERGAEVGMGKLEELRELTRGALAEMRTLLLELRPAVLTQMGLGELLRQLAEATTGRARVPVSVVVEGQRSESVALPPEVQVALYRITQEALNNVAKHAGCAGARVTLRWREDGVELEVADDGKGFDATAVEAGRLGLVGMRERAAAVGADLRVESGDGRGTRVAVSWDAARVISPTSST